MKDFYPQLVAQEIKGKTKGREIRECSFNNKKYLYNYKLIQKFIDYSEEKKIWYKLYFF